MGVQSRPAITCQQTVLFWALQIAARAHQWLQRAPPLKMAAPALLSSSPTPLSLLLAPCSEPLLIPTPIQVREQQPFLLPWRLLLSMAAGAGAQLLSMAEGPPDHVSAGLASSPSARLHHGQTRALDPQSSPWIPFSVSSAKVEAGGRRSLLVPMISGPRADVSVLKISEFCVMF
jgi:hypothetical protein